jgi:phosphoadenosine phosphosulfate reductase
MLIKCSRQTEKDLKIWDDYREFDILYYSMNEKKIKLKTEAALNEIYKFKAGYISISWGKDSTVLAHLCKDLQLPFVCFRNKFENPYNYLVRNSFLNKYPINYIEYWSEITDKNYKNGLIEFHTIRAYKKAQKDYGIKCILGIRQDESPSRTLSAMKFGVSSKSKCRPLLRWSIKDIFSYLENFELPVHPNYAMLGGGRYTRDRIRVGPLMMGSQKGAELWEKEYYGDLLNRLSVKVKVC